MIKPALRIALASFLGLLIFTSCSNSPEPSQSEIHLYLQADPFSLDPRIGGDRRSQILIRELFEGLYRISEKGIPEPALARSAEVSSDGLTYTFKLKDALWSNDLPVTSSDFEYAWKSTLSPDFATPYSYAFYLIKNARKARIGECPLNDVGISCPDKETLVVELEHPAPYFIELTSNPLYSPICKDIAESNPNWSKEGPKSYVSNGPFTLTSRTLKSEIIISKNPLYWDSNRVKSDKLYFSIIEDLQTAYNMFEQGQLDWLGDPCGNIPLDHIETLNKEKRLQARHAGGVYWYGCNVQQKHLSSARIRKAIACSIDRETLCTHLLQGGETPAFTFLPEHLTQASKTFNDADLITARKLFEEGLKEVGYTKETYPPIVISHWSDPRDKSTAQTIQQQLINALGVQVELECSDWSTYLKKMSTGDFQLAGFGWFSWFSDPMYNLEYLKFKNSGLNGTGWQDQDYIALLDKADITLDPKVRSDILLQAEQHALEQLPLIPIYFQTYKFIKAPGIQGDSLSPLGLLEFKCLERSKGKISNQSS